MNSLKLQNNQVPNILKCNDSVQQCHLTATVCPCPSYTGETSARNSTPDVASPVQRRGKGSQDHTLDLLAILILMLPRRLLAFIAAGVHCWLMFGLVFTKT